MTYTDVIICNLALSRLGENTISGLSETTKAATLCNTFFTHARDLVLDLFDWSALIERDADLTQEVTGPVSGYTYYYTLPTDCLYVIEMVDSLLPYSIEKGKLATDADPCSIRYIKAPTAYTTMGALLIEAIAAKLASVLAMPLSKSPALKSAMDAEFEAAFLRAKWQDARTRQEKDQPSDLWINAQSEEEDDDL